MKTAIMFLLAVLTSASSLHAQGTVIFVNFPAAFTTAADRFIYQDMVGGTLLTGTRFKVQLYAGSTAAEAASVNVAVDSTPSNMRALNTSVPGVWTGGLTTKIIPAPLGTKDTDIFLQVRVWDSNFGATFEAANDGYKGVSAPFLYHVPTDDALAAAYSMVNLRAFAVLPIPEPSTALFGCLAFVGLQLAGCLGRRTTVFKQGKIFASRVPTRPAVSACNSPDSMLDVTKPSKPTMKTAITSILILVAGATLASAQGLVTFANHPSAFNTQADRYIYADFVGGTLLKGTQFRVQLYAGSTPSDVMTPVDDTPSNMRATTTSFPGVWAGGLTTKVIPAPLGTKETTVWLQVRVWDSTFGPTYEAALGGLKAVSAPFSYFIPGEGAMASSLAMDNFRAFGPVVPEPGSGLLGALALVATRLWRRGSRKQEATGQE